MNHTLSWGIIGTGKIARIFASSLARSTTGKLLAIASRTQTAANRFNENWNTLRRYSSYEQLLADEEIDIVYIATPNSTHAELAIKAAEHKKHILCEKPIGLNSIEARRIIDAAQYNDVFLLEAFMYRFLPQTNKLVELLANNVIGRVQVIQTHFLIQSDNNPAGRLLNKALGGGSIMDIGCYCTSIARLAAGIAIGKTIAEPIKVTAVGHIGSTGVDEYSIASLEFPEGILAQLFCSFQSNAGTSTDVTIYGTKGSIHIPFPFFPPDSEEQMSLRVNHHSKEESSTIFTDIGLGLYSLEADAVARSIQERQAPELLWADTLGNMLTLDRWRASIGLVYATEQT